MPQFNAIWLYRRLLRDARAFPVPPIRRKLEYNYKEMFVLQRDEKDPERLQELMKAGEAALRVLRWMRHLPQVSSQLDLKLSVCLLGISSLKAGGLRKNKAE